MERKVCSITDTGISVGRGLKSAHISIAYLELCKRLVIARPNFRFDAFQPKNHRPPDTIRFASENLFNSDDNWVIVWGLAVIASLGVLIVYSGPCRARSKRRRWFVSALVRFGLCSFHHNHQKERIQVYLQVHILSIAVRVIRARGYSIQEE